LRLFGLGRFHNDWCYRWFGRYCNDGSSQWTIASSETSEFSSRCRKIASVKDNGADATTGKEGEQNGTRSLLTLPLDLCVLLVAIRGIRKLTHGGRERNEADRLVKGQGSFALENAMVMVV
jgi:hypothetical protein